MHMRLTAIPMIVHTAMAVGVMLVVRASMLMCRMLMAVPMPLTMLMLMTMVIMMMCIVVSRMLCRCSCCKDFMVPHSSCCMLRFQIL